MVSYQLRLSVSQKKKDEFVDALNGLSRNIRKEEGCLGFCLLGDLERKDAYLILGEWSSRQTMYDHFTHKYFSVLIGAARVLGSDLKVSMSEVIGGGGIGTLNKLITSLIQSTP